MLDSTEKRNIEKLMTLHGYQASKSKKSEQYTRTTPYFKHDIMIDYKESSLSVSDRYNSSSYSKAQNVRTSEKAIETLKSRIEKCNEYILLDPPIYFSSGFKASLFPETGWTIQNSLKTPIIIDNAGKIKFNSVPFTGDTTMLVKNLSELEYEVKMLDTRTEYHKTDNHEEFYCLDKNPRIGIDSEGYLLAYADNFSLYHPLYTELVTFALTPTGATAKFKSTATKFNASIIEDWQTDKEFPVNYDELTKYLVSRPGYEDIFAHFLNGSHHQNHCIACKKEFEQCECTAKDYEGYEPSEKDLSPQMLDGIMMFLEKKKVNASIIRSIRIAE